MYIPYKSIVDSESRSTVFICSCFSSLHGLKKTSVIYTFYFPRVSDLKVYFFFFLQDTDEFILPTGANKTRGRFELAFFTIGGCCMTGRCHTTLFSSSYNSPYLSSYINSYLTSGYTLWVFSVPTSSISVWFFFPANQGQHLVHWMACDLAWRRLRTWHGRNLEMYSKCLTEEVQLSNNSFFRLEQN